MSRLKLLKGNNIELLKTLPENSIDSVVTDPPYGLSFMGKKWDYDVPSVEFWKEVFRVLKPGGHILSFGGTRTYHRMVVNMEDAGFEIRDQIMWLYSTGFPKSLNIGKAVDKLEGNEREVVGEVKQNNFDKYDASMMTKENRDVDTELYKEIKITKGTSDWEGWGTALKPANEPICLARKPLSEKTIAENVLKWKTGGINIDGCRIDTKPRKTGTKPTSNEATGSGNGLMGSSKNRQAEYDMMDEGRFPANIIFDEEASKVLDEQSGIVNQGHWPKGKTKGFGEFGGGETTYEGVGPKDKTKGGASRFFYVAKVSKKERNLGCEGLEDKVKIQQIVQSEGRKDAGSNESSFLVKNNHPTVKPINLMTYLCRLITPPNGIVLDPFMGSGSTGIAAQLEGFRFCGMEMDKDYFTIAENRINNWEEYKKIIK